MDVRSIEIKQDMPGFDSFFVSWVCQDGFNIVVDAGPANTADRLVESLTAHGLERVDYVFLTHIHIDHCGGLGGLLAHYPMAKVVCHDKAITHMVDPSKLWNSSLKVLGEVAEAYGPPRPVSEERLIPHSVCDLKDLTIIETPGHAVHHLSFVYGHRLFAGEAGGNYFIVGDTEYLRPATPPRFFFEVSLGSIDRLLSLEDQPIFFAHFDQAEGSHRVLQKSREQLVLWKKIIYEQVRKGDQELLERCMEALIGQDPNLKGIGKMDDDTVKREKFFMANTIRGFIGYFKEKDNE
ncbi:MAG: MBL fold metallo-hydrolase [Desulfobacteraceae bacterium]|nr:MBL fold metallo-hydrolase [Desulfobacteraceae bacterium]